jgi:hypothetical protein
MPVSYHFAQQPIILILILTLHFTNLQTGTWNTSPSALVECHGDGSYSLEATLEPPCLLALRAEDGRRLNEK